MPGADLRVASNSLKLGPHELVQPRDRVHHASQTRADLGHVLRALKQRRLAELPPRISTGRLNAFSYLVCTAAL